MVRALHQAGIEVILDVVFNHSAETDEHGPTIHLRGLDNGAYYRLRDDNPARYDNYSGCGNTLDIRRPPVLRLVMDSLRYWATEMRVDGFRFDLAPVLGRAGDHGFDRDGPFFMALAQDPVLRAVKLIAEPWDLGHGGYQVGNFPPGWAEWNDQYRDQMRGFWKGDLGLIKDVAYRLTGSQDLYGWSGKRPNASINFVTAHDGFTLHDLVSYNDKHNEANGEDNRDGHSHNLSWNCGVEGPSDDPDVLALRERQKRNLLATLLLSQGVPMLLAGDEMGNSHEGNNNVYCQDNALAWLNWSPTQDKTALLAFVRQLIALRRRHPSFRRRNFLQGRPMGDDSHKDCAWFRADGQPMEQNDWDNHHALSMAMLLSGNGIAEHGPRGERLVDDHFLLLFNAHYDAIDFTLPAAPGTGAWQRILDTDDGYVASSDSLPPYASAPAWEAPVYPLKARSVVVLRSENAA
jgi:glycogen operon protein